MVVEIPLCSENWAGAGSYSAEKVLSMKEQSKLGFPAVFSLKKDLQIDLPSPDFSFFPMLLNKQLDDH